MLAGGGGEGAALTYFWWAGTAGRCSIEGPPFLPPREGVRLQPGPLPHWGGGGSHLGSEPQLIEAAQRRPEESSILMALPSINPASGRWPALSPNTLFTGPQTATTFIRIKTPRGLLGWKGGPLPWNSFPLRPSPERREERCGLVGFLGDSWWKKRARVSTPRWARKTDGSQAGLVQRGPPQAWPKGVGVLRSSSFTVMLFQGGKPWADRELSSSQHSRCSMVG